MPGRGGAGRTAIVRLPESAGTGLPGGDRPLRPGVALVPAYADDRDDLASREESGELLDELVALLAGLAELLGRGRPWTAQAHVPQRLVERQSVRVALLPHGDHVALLPAHDDQRNAEEGRLALHIKREDDTLLETLVLALGRFRRPIRDYFAICDSYYQAIRQSTPQQIETVDMARRGLHNAAAELLRERLAGKIDIDFDTARRLFTLIYVLHARG